MNNHGDMFKSVDCFMSFVKGTFFHVPALCDVTNCRSNRRSSFQISVPKRAMISSSSSNRKTSTNQHYDDLPLPDPSSDPYDFFEHYVLKHMYKKTDQQHIDSLESSKNIIFDYNVVDHTHDNDDDQSVEDFRDSLLRPFLKRMKQIDSVYHIDIKVKTQNVKMHRVC